MRKSLIIAVLMNSILATAVVAEQVTFTCYDPLYKKSGLYETSSVIPISLTFDTTAKTVKMVTGVEADCETILWSDPLIHFVCMYEHPDRGEASLGLVIAAGIFERTTQRFAWESVGKHDLRSPFSDEEVGEKRSTPVNHSYNECELKGF